MRLNIWRKGTFICRGIRCGRGFGVHSPFVFHLITQVIGEKNRYYCYHDIELIRKRMIQNGQITAKKAISSRNGQLLFRLTNYFKPQTILQVGPSMGISTLYLTSYRQGLTCLSLEPSAFSSVSQWVYHEAARNPIDLQSGDYSRLLEQQLPKLRTLDFVFFNNRDEQMDTPGLFTCCMPYTQDRTVFVIDGINRSKKTRRQWKEILSRPEVTVSMDLYSLGIVFLNKKLNKRNYKVYF